jgi:hypothetical protein
VDLSIRLSLQIVCQVAQRVGKVGFSLGHRAKVIGDALKQ